MWTDKHVKKRHHVAKIGTQGENKTPQTHMIL